jgi:hypothetical protein
MMRSPQAAPQLQSRGWGREYRNSAQGTTTEDIEVSMVSRNVAKVHKYRAHVRSRCAIRQRQATVGQKAMRQEADG